MKKRKKVNTETCKCNGVPHVASFRRTYAHQLNPLTSSNKLTISVKHSPRALHHGNVRNVPLEMSNRHFYQNS